MASLLVSWTPSSRIAWEWDQSACRLSLFNFFFPRQTQSLCLLWFGLTISWTWKWVDSSISGRNNIVLKIRNSTPQKTERRGRRMEADNGTLRVPSLKSAFSNTCTHTLCTWHLRWWSRKENHFKNRWTLSSGSRSSCYFSIKSILL